MKKALFISLIICLALASALFAVPQYFTYQGVLRDGSGNLVSGTRSMVFNIYDAATAGTLKYGPQNEPAVVVNGGAYSVQLGPITSGSTVFDGGDRYLEVSVGGTTLSPRLKINSVAYSLRADSATDAGTLAGHAPAATSTAGGIPFMGATGKLDSSVIPASSSPTNALTLSGFPAGISGNSIVPTTDAQGRLNLSTIPSVDAASVDGIHANTTATASQILSLDSNKQLKGMSISAEATSTNNAIYINGGKIGMVVGGDGSLLTPGTGCVGRGSIPQYTKTNTIYNNLVTTNSYIFITPITKVSTTLESIVVTNKIDGASFDAGFSNSSYGSTIYFNYLIIN